MNRWQTGDIIVRDAVEADVHALKDRLREKDKQEILATFAPSVECALADAFERSAMVYTIERAGVPVAMFGVEPETILSPAAVVWFLGADEMKSIKKAFLRGTRFFLDKFLDRYPLLFNIVDARYTETIRWLKAFGAKFEEPKPFGPQGQPFAFFTLRRA